MPVIAMTREMGSQGKDIAIGLAERLGLNIVHHNLVEHDIADKLHTEESDVHRYLEGKTKQLERWSLRQNRVANYTASEVLELAERGNVIIRGWGSPALLRPVAHVLCLRVCAPMAQRIKTLMDRVDITDPKTARQEIETNDAAHERVLKRLVHGDWHDPLLYDLVINTERVPVEEGVDLVAHVLKLPPFQETPQSQAKLRLLRTEAQVKNVLSYDPALKHDTSAINVSVNPDTFSVTLSGGVLHRQTLDKVVMALGTLPDITEIRNTISVVKE